MTPNDRAPMRGRLAALAVVAFAFVTGASVVAHAEPRDLERSKKLFDEARELMASGDYTAACPKLEESVKLKPGLGARFNLADCWEHVGRSASARILFLDVAGDAEGSGQTERRELAESRAAALESKVARLVVRVASPVEGLELKRDDKKLERSEWATPTPLDPGTYVLAAAAPGKKAWTTRVEVPKTPAGLLVSVEVPALESNEPPPKPAAAPAPKPPAKAPPSPAKKPLPAAPETGGTARTAALILGGAGVGALFVGGVAALEYRSRNGDAEATCPLSVACTPADIAAHDRAVEQARTARGIAFVGFGIGAAALAGAIGLYTFGAPSRERASVGAGPLVGDGAYGARVAGNF